MELLPERMLWLKVSEFGLESFVYGFGTRPYMWVSLEFLGLWCLSTKSASLPHYSLPYVITLEYQTEPG